MQSQSCSRLLKKASNIGEAFFLRRKEEAGEVRLVLPVLRFKGLPSRERAQSKNNGEMSVDSLKKGDGTWRTQVC